MNKLIPCLLILLFSQFKVAYAQREPQQTQWMLNKLSFNPAYAGTQGDKICITGLFHDQWQNYKSTEGKYGGKAPQSIFVNAHMPLQIGNNEFGIGVSLLNDRVGFEKVLNFGANVAYHKQLSFAKFSGGLNANFGQTSLNGDFKSRDANDPLQTGINVGKPNISIGIGTYFYDPKWNVGFSLQNINQPKLPWGTDGKTPTVLNLHGGYIYRIKNTKVDLLPAILYKTDFSKSQIDIAAMAQYDEFVFGGLNYHSGDAIALIAGIKYKDYTFSTSYDITTSDARSFGGKVEFVVKYCFSLNLPPNEIIFHKGVRFL